MPTVSAHLPEATFRRLRKVLGKNGNPSAFLRQAVEEKLDTMPPRVTAGFLRGTGGLAADFDPGEPVFPEADSDPKDGFPA